MVKQKHNSELAEKLLIRNKNILDHPELAPSCFIGFDGFTDEIIYAVDKRTSHSEYKTIKNMADFGNRIISAAGKSCNIELVSRQKKLGGNAPIMANALLQGGHRIIFAGAIGLPKKIEPIFEEMASRCEKTYPLSPSGYSQAIEFEDGKVILGKFTDLLEIDYNTLLEQINAQSLQNIFNNADLFVSANWTMLPKTTEIWTKIAKNIAPRLASGKPHWMFVDLADPKKRTAEDILEALQVLRKLEGPFQVILGLNQSEAEGINSLLGEKNNPEIQALAETIQKKSGLHQIVVHNPKFAASATHQKSDKVATHYTPKPFLTTGAGDNFNAGFCNALLYKLSLKEMLQTGVATAGYYVRNGKSPTMFELAAFLNQECRS